MNTIRFQPPIRPTRRRDQLMNAEHRRNVSGLNDRQKILEDYIDYLYSIISGLDLDVEIKPPPFSTSPYRGQVRG